MSVAFVVLLLATVALFAASLLSVCLWLRAIVGTPAPPPETEVVPAVRPRPILPT